MTGGNWLWRMAHSFVALAEWEVIIRVWRR
jgi:hypothetical protein